MSTYNINGKVTGKNIKMADTNKAIKNKDTAIEAAQKTLQAHNQKIVESAQAKLSAVVAKWEEETGCSFVISGRFQGNQAEAGLQVVIKPK